MALDYADLFEDLGKLVKYWTSNGTVVSALEAELAEILTALQDEAVDYVGDGLTAQYATYRGQHVARRRDYAARAILRLQDRETVLLEIGAINSSQQEVLSKLITQMRADGESINASAVSIGSVTAVGTATTTGKGTIVATKVLDGVTPPGANMPAMLDYAGRDSELAVAETVTLVCITDSFTDRVIEGSEQFQVYGATPDPNGQHGIDAEGSGSLGTVQAIHGSTAQYLANPDFESFSVTDTPDSWTIVAGTVTTHIGSTTTAGQFYHGATALRFTGDGAQTSISIEQSMPNTKIVANRAYLITMRLKASAAGHAGTFTAIFTGTGYTAATAEKIQIAANTIDDTAFELQSFVVVMPAIIPSDFTLRLTWSGTPSNADSIYIDDIAMAPVPYLGGLGWMPVRGSVPFQRGDKFTAAVGNTEGVLQGFSRRTFGVQLPSDSGGTETIADSVAS